MSAADSTDDPSTKLSHVARAPWIAAASVCLLGATAAHFASRSRGGAPGAAQLTSPDVLLAVFDAWWVLLCAQTPARRGLSALADVAVIVVVGVPFHMALASASGTPVWSPAILLAAAFGAAAVAGASRRRAAHSVAVVVAAFGLPLAGYALKDLAGIDALALVDASPLTGPALLARRGPDATMAQAAPALVAAAAIAVVGVLPSLRRVSATALLFATLALLSAPAFAEVRIEQPLGGIVRPGRPVVVRSSDVARVRLPGTPWVTAVGADGNEFVIPGAIVTGEVLRLEVTTHDRETSTVELPVRVLPAAGRITARLDGGDLAENEIAVAATGLPTVAEAWLIFDDATGEPDGLPSAARTALERFRTGARGAPFQPWAAEGSREAYRAFAALAPTGPTLPVDVARLLLILAGAELLLLLALRRTPGNAKRVAWLLLPPIAVATWWATSAWLPGPLRADAVVVGDDTRSVVFVRIDARADGAVTIEPPADAGLPCLVRFEADDGSEAGVSLGRSVQVDLPQGSSRIVAFALSTGIEPGASPVEPHSELTAWLRRAGFGSPAGSAAATEAQTGSVSGTRLTSHRAWMVTPGR